MKPRGFAAPKNPTKRRVLAEPAWRVRFFLRQGSICPAMKTTKNKAYLRPEIDFVRNLSGYHPGIRSLIWSEQKGKQNGAKDCKRCHADNRQAAAAAPREAAAIVRSSGRSAAERGSAVWRPWPPAHPGAAEIAVRTSRAVAKRASRAASSGAASAGSAAAKATPARAASAKSSASRSSSGSGHIHLLLLQGLSCAFSFLRYDYITQSCDCQ